MAKGKLNVKEKEESIKTYNPQGEELKVKEFLFKRIESLKEARKKKLPNFNRSIEEIWAECDREYTPHELDLTSSKKRFEANDELGLRSRLVKIGSTDTWQSNNASPDFYVKVNVALSILIDQNPEAVFMASSSKYEKNTLVVQNNWKNSWEITGAKQQLKNFVFNQAKYGIGYARTYPKIIEIDKQIRTEYYPEDPKKDQYETKRLVKFNDLCRESLNPWDVWTSEMARPGDPFSMDDWYFEQNYSEDKFNEVFKDCPNKDFAKGEEESQDNEGKQETVEKVIKVGFYENQVRDLYTIGLPKQKVVLYKSPLPNDDGKLSLWFAPWTLRNDKTILGIGIWEIIKQDSILYDKLANMTMDQLVLSIYKMFFYKGTDILGENGMLLVSPGKGEQVIDPNAIKFMEVPGPGQDAWKGLQFLQEKRDSNSGITPQLSAKFQGKTLGQDIQAKEAALERMKTPFDYLLDALQQEAFIAISWQKQILSVPEVLEYNSPELLSEALGEMGLQQEQIQTYLQEIQNPQASNDLVFQEQEGEQEVTDEMGNTMMQPRMKTKVNVYPEARFGIDKDDKGELIESQDKRFYRFGVDLPLGSLKWEGIIRIKPQSVLAPSKELSKRMKLDLFNLVQAAMQGMLAQPQHIPVLLPPIKEIIKVYEEDVKDWIEEEHLNQMFEQAMQPPPPPPDEKPRMSLSVKLELLPFDTQQAIMKKYFDIDLSENLFIDNPNFNPETQGQGQAQGRPQEFKPLVPRGTIEPGKTEEGAMAAAMRIE